MSRIPADVASQLVIADFKASNGWLEQFNVRHAIKACTVSDESAGVDLQTVDDFVVVFQKLAPILNLVTFLIVMKLVFIIVHYQTGHFPLKVYLLKVLRTLKERSTIMFACSATGEKLKPLVISKALTPRCVRGICNFCIDIRQNPINHMAIL